MGVVETLRVGVARSVFLFKHESTPELVERARRVVVENDKILQGWLDGNLITKERLQEIENNGEVQQRYRNMIKQARDGNSDNTIRQYLELPIDEKAGWLEYFRKFHEERFHINLLTDQQITAKI
jgi:hypothetical protein